MVKVEFTPQGSQRRFVVTNLQDRPEVIYQHIYVQRGAVPEQPIGELKNGLRSERLSAHGFCANAFRLALHAVAYALVVLFREACAGVPEVATAQVSSLRQRLWKVGAVVVRTARRISIHLSGGWPYQDVFVRVLAAVRSYVARWEVSAAQNGRVSGVAM